MATKDLTKVDGMYVIKAANVVPEMGGNVYIGYGVAHTDYANAWKFRTREAAEKAIKNGAYENVFVTIVL